MTQFFPTSPNQNYLVTELEALRELKKKEEVALIVIGLRTEVQRECGIATTVLQVVFLFVVALSGIFYNTVPRGSKAG